MSKKVNPTAVGIFVTGAIVCMVLGVFVLGSGKLRETRKEFVIYFKSSANGLKMGSDVLLGGVKVGSVQRMYVQFDPETKEKVIPVVIDLSADRISALSPDAPSEIGEILADASIDDAISRGLRARLVSLSALTGQLYIDLEFMPEDQAGYTYPAEPIEGLKQIPSTKNQIEQVLEKIAEGVEKIGGIDIAGLVENMDKLVTDIDTKVLDLDFKGISDNANSTLAHLDEAITDGDLKGAIANLNASVGELKDLLAKVDGDNINKVLENAAGAMEQLQSAGANIARLTGPEAPVAMRLTRTLADLDAAARSIRELADFLKRNPNALITGKKRP